MNNDQSSSSTYELYHYFRSSCSYRVRIALNIKKIPCQFHAVNLLKNEQNEQNEQKLDYQKINPQRLVPSLITPDKKIITQSLSIIEYLEELYPEPALLPQEPILKAKVRAFAQAIACEIHPINNLRVLNYLKQDLNLKEEQVNAWYQHWINLTFLDLEQIAKLNSGRFCFGDQPTLADIVLVPQIYNAHRYKVDMSAYPTLSQIDKNCSELPAFQAAHPDQFAGS